MAATPFAASILLCLFGSIIGRRLPPATAAKLLTALAVTVATATGLVLAAAGVLTLAQAPRIAADGHWSARTLHVSDHLPIDAGAAAGVIVVGLLIATVVKAAQAICDLTRATIACRRLAPSTTDVVILDDDTCPRAYTIAGLRGPGGVSTAMVRGLGADERPGLVAPEAAPTTIAPLHCHTWPGPSTSQSSDGLMKSPRSRSAIGCSPPADSRVPDLPGPPRSLSTRYCPLRTPTWPTASAACSRHRRDGDH